MNLDCLGQIILFAIKIIDDQIIHRKPFNERKKREEELYSQMTDDEKRELLRKQFADMTSN
jgi:hypothetical protein